MRCTLCHFTVLALSVGIVGCGVESDSPGRVEYDSLSSESYSEATNVERSMSRPADGAVQINVSHDESDAESVPTAIRSDHRETSADALVSRNGDDPVMPKQASTWRPATQFQPGTLTAGSIDDNAKFDEFRSYLSDTLQQNPGRQFPTLAIGRRIIIKVENEQGEGIGDARVTVRPVPTDNDTQAAGANARPAMFEITTGSDGRALFFSGRDASSFGPEFLLTVQQPGDSKPVTQRVSLEQAEWTVTLADAQRRLPVGLDLALVIDTTGSMSDELEYLKVEIDDIAAAVHKRFPNVDQRFALVLYRDEDDQYVTRTFDFTGSLADFRQKLSAQSAAGGGDYPEAMHLALEQASQLSWRPKNTARVLFLVGDAPPHSRFADRTIAAVDGLRRAGVTLFPVAASGTRDEAEWIMRSAAFLTLGRYLFLTDHSGVGNAHAKPHTPRFAVERLNALMIRMISSELAGRELLPHEIIGTEANVSSTVSPQKQTVVPTLRPYQSAITVTNNPPAADALFVAGQWFDACITSTPFRFCAAAIAIALILLLDTRWRRIDTSTVQRSARDY
jgi:hypothetical protein